MDGVEAHCQVPPGVLRGTIRCHSDPTRVKLKVGRRMRANFISMKHNILDLAVALLMTACGGPQESASMKEAKAIHEQLTRISGELHDAILEAMEPAGGPD